MKITKRHNSLIRGPGGRFASQEQKRAVIAAKKRNPGKTYKELSKAWIEKNKPAYTPPVREPDTGRIISNKALADIKKASRQLGISQAQAMGLYLENRLMQVNVGNTMVHSLLATASAYADRVFDLIIKIKYEGDTRFKKYNAQHGLGIINKMNRKIFKDLRKKYGPKIDSDKIPLIPLVQKIKPGDTAPSVLLVNYNKVFSMEDLEDDERDMIMEELVSGAHNKKSKNEVSNNSNRRAKQNKRPVKRTKKK